MVAAMRPPLRRGLAVTIASLMLAAAAWLYSAYSARVARAATASLVDRVWVARTLDGRSASEIVRRLGSPTKVTAVSHDGVEELTLWYVYERRGFPLSNPRRVEIAFTFKGNLARSVAAADLHLH